MTTNTHYQKIWRTAQLIPVGKVTSYGQLADLAGLPRRARLVGKALGCTSPEMCIPWHRVLRADGKIAFGAGSEQGKQQQSLLQEEGVVVLNRRVSFNYFGWQPNLADMLWKLEF